MSKLNKSMAAKVARQNKQYFSGVVRDGSYYSHYSQGMDSWQSAVAFSSLWHPHKQAGWRRAMKDDVKFAEQCPAAQARVMARLHLLDCIKEAA